MIDLNSYNNILIHFSGITISRECIIIKGFPNNNDLNNARDQLREKFFYRKLNVNIDPHYKLITAHSTIARFRDNLNDPTKLVKYLLSIKDFDFGISQIDRFLLVYNDWYMSPSKTKVIGEFLFKK